MTKIILEGGEPYSGGELIVSGPSSAKPGDLTLSSGVGTPCGSLILQLGDEQEFMRFDPDGRVRVRGNIVANDKEVYKLFKQWLQFSTYDWKLTKELEESLCETCKGRGDIVNEHYGLSMCPDCNGKT